ncbi:MAG: LLM class flavin-dependent oxidoreductase [Pseudomonadales bacterium]|nr:LLM class flavin-dependent oxidoreductase [Pseudomonadales bacterium]MDP6470622.1 LLM class flavin-dependent oxidoreductase [Pseudomonadales bacterium]MDP6828523.1 LLM class flavin-dependent oxidoreductase [Pseudomonadales bacterium]MDP6973130.1 LLM class flavin-dependent oxidoreductase [Pseudomonadales bacterium]
MTVAAGLGIANFTFDDARGFWKWVDMCDAGGVDSIWQSDRIIAAEDNLECMSVMAALAGRTKRIKFGMNVASLGLRDPVLIAKQCATIDVLSEGRLLPAFGVGSARSRDYVAINRPTRGRGKRSGEGLEIISRLWSEESVTFNGKFYQLDQATIAPRPVQHPLPLWVGGSAKPAIERTARWGTGWQAGIESPEDIAPVISAIKARVLEIGRTIDEDHYGAGFGFRFGAHDHLMITRYNEMLKTYLGREPKGFTAAGDVGDIMALVNEYRHAGVEKFILRPIARGTQEMLEQTKLFIEKLMPEIAALNT